LKRCFALIRLINELFPQATQVAFVRVAEGFSPAAIGKVFLYEAYGMLVLIGISLVVVVVDPLVTHNLRGASINLVATFFFLVVFFINRSGRLVVALAIMLIVFSVLPIASSVILGSPIPTIFFACAAIVIAAAFGSARAPLIWAGVATAVPWITNGVMYGALLPPAGPVTLPNGIAAPPLLVMEIMAIVLYWILGGISWMTTRQLYQTIQESSATAQAAMDAQQALAAQQADLASRNAQLTQVRQELEALVAALAVPVVPVADGIGLLPLVGALDAIRAAEVERKVLAVVSEQRMRALVIDLSGVSGLQNGGITALVRLCAALRLLGVTPVLAGLGAQGAMLLSEANLALPRTAATVQDALLMLQ
jgi:anti-anti-sigma regulatory factor